MNTRLILDNDESDKDPRDVTGNSFNRFDPKYVSIGPKNLRNNLSTNPNKCATLKHGGKFGGSLSPNPRNIPQPQPIVTPPQHFQLQQHHLQKPNNQQLEIQTYQLQQQSYQQQAAQLHQQQLELQQLQQQQQQQQQSFNVATVSRDYNQHYPASTLPYKKPGTGFIETSSILKKHREEVHELSKPQTVFSIETSTHRQPESRSSKSISIINQPLPEIPKQQSNAQVLSAANLSNYRSLQRPQPTSKSSYPSGTTQRSREHKPAPPILPPKNRQQSLLRGQQPLPNGQKMSSQSYNQQQYPSKSYDRERSRERDRSNGRPYDDSHQYRTSSKQQQQQQNFQTLPHHHHHPTSSFSTQTTSTKSNRKSDSSKSLHRSSREMSHPRFENYSATEL